MKSLYNLPLENSMVPQPGVGGGKGADIINNYSSSPNGLWVNSPWDSNSVAERRKRLEAIKWNSG